MWGYCMHAKIAYELLVGHHLDPYSSKVKAPSLVNTIIILCVTPLKLIL